MSTDISVTLTSDEATHLVLALGFLLDPEAGLFGAAMRQNLRRVRDRVLEAQRQATRPQPPP